MKKIMLLFILTAGFLLNSCDVLPVSAPNNQIKGNVSCNDGTSPVGTIVSLETSAGYPLASFVVNSLEGYFSFGDLSSGDYKIYASLDVNSDGIDDYDGTYGGDSSKVITLFGSDTLSVDITLKRIVTYANKSFGSDNR